MNDQPPLKIFLIKLLLLGILLTFLPLSHYSEANAPIPPTPIEPIEKVWTQDSLTDMIYSVSRAYKWPYPELIIGLAQHESVWLKYPYIIDINDKPSRGLYHFQESTFDEFCVHKFGLKDDIDDPEVQTICAIKMGRLNLIHKRWVLSYQKITK